MKSGNFDFLLASSFRRIKDFGLIFLCLISFKPQLHCQTFFPINYTNEDGLPSNNIYKITQDKEGYIWVGTQNGLARFTGSRFISYYNPDMSDQDIIHLVAAEDTSLVGFVNLSGEAGLASKSKLELLKINVGKDSSFKDLEFGPEGNLWLWETACPKNNSDTCPTNFVKYELNGHDLKRFEVNQNAMSDIRWDKRKEHFFIGGNFSIFISKEGKILDLFANKDAIHGSSSSKATHTAITREQIPVGDDGWLLLINIDRRRRELAYTNEKSIHVIKWKNAPAALSLRSVIENKNGGYWLGTNKGLLEVDIDENFVGTIKKTYLDSDVVQGLFYDREQNLWIGTERNGIFLLPYDKYPVYSNQFLGIKGNGPRVMASTDSSIWAVEQGGKLFNIHDKGQVYTYQLDSLSSLSNCYLGPENSLILTSNSNTYQLDLSNLTTTKFGKGRFNGNNFKFKGDVGTLNFACTKDIIFQDNYLWISSCLRLFKIGLLQKEVQGLFRGRTVSAHWDSIRSKLWISTLQGIFNYTEEDSLQLVQDKNGQSLDFYVYSMAQDDRGNIYFGSHGKGLWCWKDDEFINLTPEFDQMGKSFSDLLFYRGWLWIITERGLAKINLSTREFIPIGGPALQTELYKLARTGDNLWISSRVGLVKLNSNYGESIGTDPKVYLESFEAQDNTGEVLNQRILSHRYNQVRIDFSTPYFGKKIQYQYQLNKGNWQELPKPPLLLSALKPGAYSIRIRAKTLANQATSNQLIVNFYIKSPIWTKPEFIISLIAFLGILILLYIRNFYLRRYKRFQEKERMLREIESMRIKALQAQMNPHFTFNALNAIQDQLLNNDAMGAVNYLADFARLIRKTLDMVDRPFICLDEEIGFLETYIRLELIRREKKIEVKWTIDPQLAPSEVRIPPMLLQPLIENSFKHGFHPEITGPELHINIQKRGDNLLIEVIDNGVGFKHSSKNNLKNRGHESYGVRLVKDRLAILPTTETQKSTLNLLDLSEENKSLKGTKAVITIPYKLCRK
ncbi:MAG: histidine kinase [Bacteroidia bacterium]|nr:histidine kinase [Bacteroidia bacterium]